MANIETIITENIDVWTSALRRRATQGRGSSSRIELYGVQKLRELILDLAVRGLLVPQDPSDEPASVLLRKITAEKERLIKDKKIRKNNSLPNVREDEKLFTLAEGWRWVRLGDTGIGSTGKTPSTRVSEYFGGDIPFIGPGEITSSGVLLDSSRLLTEAGIKNSTEALTGDVLMVCIGGSIGKSAIADKRLAFNQQINSLHPLFVLSSYLNVVVNSRAFYQSLLEKATGSATPIINRTKWEELLIPLAPEKEQSRIVKKVNELMKLCDQLEKQQENSIAAHQQLVEVLLTTLTQAADQEGFDQAWSRIAANFEILFTTESSVEQLKQTILQLAVMGKLVKQDPEDEPASVLLERVAVEREQLIKAKKIRKTRDISDINDKDHYYHLPKNWSWARLADIGHDWGQKKPDKIFTYIDVGSINREKGVVENPDQLEPEKAPSRARKLVRKGTVIYSTVRPYLLNVAVISEQIRPEPIASTAFAIIHPFKEVDASYIYHYLRSQAFIRYVENCQTGVAYPAINDRNFFSGLIPIPPAAEQKRIVKKVEDLFAICDQFKTQLRTAKETKLKLADAITSQAVQ